VFLRDGKSLEWDKKAGCIREHLGPFFLLALIKGSLMCPNQRNMRKAHA
jgi:hypothetical protein